MKHIFPLLIAVFIMSSCSKQVISPTQNRSGWSVIYQNDKNGSTTNGQKEDLITAVIKGCDIRVGWGVNWTTRDGEKGKIEHISDANFLSIFNGNVFAQLAPIMRQIPQTGQNRIHLDTMNNMQWYALLGTTGELSATYTGTNRNRIQNIPMRWYINKNDCPLND